MARVYVSSTFRDLQDCREQVRLTLRRMQHDDVAMEYYVAEETRPVDKCLRDVERCDLYLCLVAWRYGYIPPGYEHSITELEYRRAAAAGIPRLVFLLDEETSWPVSRIERGALDRLEVFRQELQQNQTTVSLFTGAADIGRHVAEAVHAWEKKQSIASAGGRTNWEAYRAAVFAKHRWVRLEAIAGPEQDRLTHIPLADVFVAQRTTTGRPAFDVPEHPADEAPGDAAARAAGGSDTVTVLQEPSLQVIGREPKQVILGGPGSGKSTLFHSMMLTLCDPAPSESALPLGLRDGPLPLLVELRQYALRMAGGQVQDFVGYLAAQSRDFYGVDISADDLRALLQQPRRTLVLFDGLDEVLNSNERARIAEQFDAFARKYPEARVVVSSRIVGYNPERLRSYGFSHYTLLDFGLTEIRGFVPRWYRHYTWQGDERDAAGLLGRITASPKLRELAGNPLLLTMMAVIYKHQDLPEKRWQLYQRCTQVLLEHWDVKRKNIEQDKIFPLGFRMTGDQKAEILQRVSMHMLRQHHEGGELNAIQRQPLLEILAGYLQETFKKTPGDAGVIATEILNHLRERTYILAEIGEDVFGFVHRTFMEYFAASHALAEFSSRKADYTWLKEKVYGANWQGDEWQEVLLLLIAMLADQKFPIEEVVDYLWLQAAGPEPRSLAFAARCLGEAGATDGRWAQNILTRLIEEILQRIGETSKQPTNQFVSEALTAYALLVPTVRPRQSLVRKIEGAGKRSRRRRQVTWQMEFALQSREDRRVFATQALTDREEAVRIGAINALEREWPGKEEVGAALVDVLCADTNTRVRQAAVQALRQSWPEQPEILQAIAERADDETAYTHILWVIEYVSAKWGNDPAALDVVLRLAATQHRDGWGEEAVVGLIVQTAAEKIAATWGGQPGIVTRLQNRFSGERDPYVRATILIALAMGWQGDEELFGWLQERLDWDSGQSTWVQSRVINAIAEGWAGVPGVFTWLQRHATDNAEPEVRRTALSMLANKWQGDPQVRAWLEHRATDDPDAWLQVHGFGKDYGSMG